MNTNNEIITSLFSKERAITVQDCSRLINQISDDIGNVHVSPKNLHDLYLLTSKSKKFGSNEISSDVVTLNSKVVLITESKIIRLIRIVLPNKIEHKNDISVYSPLGIACLGSREGDTVFVRNVGQDNGFLIEKIIFQPEKEKLYNL